MTKKEKQDYNWGNLNDETKQWAKGLFTNFIEYKTNRSWFIVIMDSIFGHPHVLAEQIIKEYGKHNLEPQNQRQSDITEMTVEPSPQWMKDAGKEIQERYKLEYVDKVYISGIIAKHYRQREHKKSKIK